MFSVKGCENFFAFRYKNRPHQIIYLFGEDHELPGNSLTFLDILKDANPCSIDVIVEKEFQTLYHHDFKKGRSNISLFADPPISDCTHPSMIPEPTQIRNSKNKHFFQTCIQPYEGKLKIWATDIRMTHIFYLAFEFLDRVYDHFERTYKKNSVLLAQVQKLLKNDADFKLWVDEIRNFQKGILNFDLYNQNPKRYNEIIINSLLEIFDMCPTKYRYIIPKFIMNKILPKHRTIQEKVGQILTSSRDKSHLKLAEKITKHIPEEVYQNWQKYMFNIIDDDDVLDLFVLTIFFDLESLYRLYNLLKKQREGFIVIFAGSAHTQNIADMLKLDPDFELQMESNDHIPAPNQINLNIPTYPCTEKTQLMRLYEKFFHSPSPSPRKKKIDIRNAIRINPLFELRGKTPSPIKKKTSTSSANKPNSLFVLPGKRSSSLLSPPKKRIKTDKEDDPVLSLLTLLGKTASPSVSPKVKQIKITGSP